MPNAAVCWDTGLEEVPVDGSIVHGADLDIALVDEIVGKLDVDEALVGVDFAWKIEEVNEHHNEDKDPPEGRQRVTGVGTRPVIVALQEERGGAVPERVLKAEVFFVLRSYFAPLGSRLPLVGIEVVDEAEYASDDEECAEVDEPDFDAEDVEKTEGVVVYVVRILQKKLDASAHEGISKLDISETLFSNGDRGSRDVSFLQVEEIGIRS